MEGSDLLLVKGETQQVCYPGAATSSIWQDMVLQHLVIVNDL